MTSSSTSPSSKFQLTSEQAPTLAPAATPGSLPTIRQIFQLRRNFGVNLGSCFIMEKWMFDQFFGGGALCELEAAKYLIQQFGEDEARRKLESFWSLFMADSDWQWLKDHCVTSVRVPIGYWDIDGGRFTPGTKFEPVRNLYINAWSIFKTNFVQKARGYDIGIHFDLHGLPFGANDSDNGGETGGGNPVGFWLNDAAQRVACDALAFVAADLKGQDNITGLGIVNEAESSTETGSRAKYYIAAASAIRGQNDSIPIFISDGWWPNQWAEWIRGQQGNGNCGFVIDTHCYRCFSNRDKLKSPQQIIDDLDGDFLTNLTDNGKGVDFVVGEYSCVFDSASWNRDNADQNRDALVSKFGHKQQYVFQQRAGCGSYFWAYKFEKGNGGEWGFRNMVDKGAVIPLWGSSNVPSSDTRDSHLETYYNAHVNYWNIHGKGTNFEHYRFRDGFTTAWNDATTFAEFNSSAIGRLEAWKAARLQEHVSNKGSLKFLWEWEEGFSKGFMDFYNSF